MKLNPEPWLEPVIRIAQAAGREILHVYNSGFDVTRKHDNTPLTQADLAAHHCIEDGLEQLTQDFPILSEESTHIAFHERSQWETYWLVDPLDGTREFIKRNGEFTVNIALIHKQKSILGVVYTPVTGVCYFACKGEGAYKQEPGKTTLAIHSRKKPGKKVIVAGSRSHRGDSLIEFLQKIGPYDIISMGSSLKSCLVAEGKADIYPRLGPTSEWDTAAAQCVVEEAGGVIMDLQMQPLRYNTKRSLLNPFFLVCGDKQYDWGQYF
ncbi:MAG: 3'(2'),5'-bisphosphate nucleotidase CysQ [Gammaproteobacteria bacterium]|nr:3'(2'),5'-bisphosphate nucleotidase CysQ [Gammaproteobacteria bacterium]MDH5799670.1 3'(2'),5'-bisphosphate nucleotidase CysQ [Gammaproteobacteria bacterium]